MFSAAHRLRDRKIYDKLFKRGAWVRSKHFGMVTMPTPGSGRIGFIISKKVVKSAAARNAVKRQIRAAFLLLAKDPETKPLFTDYTTAVVLHKKEVEGTFAQLVEEVKYALLKVPTAKAKA